MKRVLVFVPEFPVLSETFIEREIIELSKSDKIAVTVVSLKKGNSEPSKDLESFLHYIRVTPLDILSGLVMLIKTGNFTVLAKSLSLLLKNKNRPKKYNIYTWVKCFGFAYLFSKYNPQQIHSHFLSEGSTICAAVSILLGVPLSISAHARDVFGHSVDVAMNPELIEEKGALSKFIVLCNKKAYQSTLSKVCEKDKPKIKLQYHGVPIKHLEKLEDGDKNNKEKICIANFGRLVEKKGLTYLLEAARILKEKNYTFILKLGGFGPLYDHIIAEAAALGLTHEFFQMVGDKGGLQNDELIKNIHLCDIFVVPSIELSDGDSDGIPNTVLEAGIMKRPVITTDAGSIADIITNKVTGIIVPQRDSEQLAKSIEELINDAELRQKLALSLHDLVVQKFDLQRNVKDIEDLLCV